MIEADQWENCYDQGWQGEITPESFSHPAKFSRALIRRIYEHAFEEGWLVSGVSTVLDPFAGVALGALDAMWNGLNWIGVELEPKFTALGLLNIMLWERKYGSKEGFGTARIIQGDSRELRKMIQGADCCIGSPPFNENKANQIHGQSKGFHSYDENEAKNRMKRDYILAESPGNLGAMKEGDFDCVVGSPPYSGDPIRERAGKLEAPRLKSKGLTDQAYGLQRGTNPFDGYGQTEGQLASLPEGWFEAIVGSPPFSEDHSRQTKLKKDWNNKGGNGFLKAQGFAKTDGNIAREQGDTFWSAVREILLQCHAILKPGGHAIWVTKRFVRAGKIIEFSDQWQALCESVGFRLVCRHKAMLVKNHGAQETIFGGIQELKTERKSFFRRLAEKKGSPKIDFEDVICFVRI